MGNDSDKTDNDLPRVETVRIEIRDEHLNENELIAFSAGTLKPDLRFAAMRHLDQCERCREVLAELHRDDDDIGETKLRDSLLGTMLGEYRVEDALSRGGMGAVYRGVQPMIGKKVAIKVLLPEASQDPDQMHRLLSEARAVNAIRHPNIIDIFSFGSLPGGKHYFVMELLDGHPLNELLREKRKFSPGEVLTILEQSMAALGAAHQAGVIHRDLKPANLFVTTLPDKSWHITVLDFGLAKQLGQGPSTSPNLVMGTPGFMAPEQIRGMPLTPKADMYAMGCVAWVLLTGEEPFHADSYVDLLVRHLEEPLPALAKAAPGCPPSLVSLVERLLNKRADARPSAMEVQAELQRMRKDFGGQQTMKLAQSPMVPLEQLQKPHVRQVVQTVPVTPAVARKEDAGPTRIIRSSPELPKSGSETDPDRPAALRRVAATMPNPVIADTPEGSPAVQRRGGIGPLPIAAAVVVLGLIGFAIFHTVTQPEVTPAIPKPVVVPPVVVVEDAGVEDVDAGSEPEFDAGVAAVEVAPKQPRALTADVVHERIIRARVQSARIESANIRRVIEAELNDLDQRLSSEKPRAIAAELDELVKRYQLK